MFDFDDSQEIVFQAKTAGKSLIAAKYDALQVTGDFLFNAHTDGEFAQRCEMVDDQISKIAFSRLANVSDSKTKLVKALHTEWSLRHAKCEDCNCGKNRKFAKSTCEKCADGELDSDSPLCKACRSKNASRHESSEMYLTPLGDLIAGGMAATSYGIQKLIDRKNKNKNYDDYSNDEDGSSFGKGHVENIRPESNPYDWKEEDHKDVQKGKRPFDWERDASRKLASEWDYGGYHGGERSSCKNCNQRIDWNPYDKYWESGVIFGQKDGQCPDGSFHTPMEDEQGHTSSRTANKYIEKRGDSWVILQKGTGKVLSHHDSKEKAEASFRAMMQSKHGSTWVTAHMADGDYCPNCDGAGCGACGSCGQCGGELDPYGDHYGSIGCPAYNHNMSDVMRHDQGHDDWHAMYGDSPCTSEEDCAAKASRYDNMDNMRENGEPEAETQLHDDLHEDWHRQHGDTPCTSVEDCKRKSRNYRNS